MRELCLFVTALFWAAAASAQSSGSMLSACKQITTAKASDRVMSVPQDFDSGLCWGAFGIIEQIAKASARPPRLPQAAWGICIPEKTPRSRLIAAFTEFAKSHPEREQEDFYTVARDALRGAFSCQAAPAKGSR